MSNQFKEHALSNGQEGAVWLEQIPKIISEHEKQWGLQVLPPFDLSYNYVAPTIRADGSQAVLKIGFPKDREFQTEINALEVFQGEGIEKLLEEDRANSTILIERVIPGIPLSSIADDEQATKILAGVMKKLRKPLPANHNFITIAEWMRELTNYKNTYQQGVNSIPQNLITKATSLFDELLATSKQPVLVHGDLHHDNILSSDRDGWLAIDPKGVAAEPEYETAAMIRNPYASIMSRPNLEDLLKRRIEILAEELHFDPQRILKWCFAQTVLSAVWSDAGVKGSQHSIRIAQVLDSISF